MATSMSKAAVSHDEEFYLQDIIFQVSISITLLHLSYNMYLSCLQVENRLFKVPRQIFIHQSQVFRDMFSLPVPEGTKADGTSDDKPLKLDGIAAVDFIRLLRYLIPIKYV